MALVRRKITLQFAYGTGPSGDGPPQSVTLSGHRVSVNVANAGGAGMPTAHVRIFGLTLSMMNQLSTMGQLPNAYRANTISVYAGDDVIGMAKIFEGTIQEAWADMQAAPEVAFNITAFAGLIDALRRSPPLSYPGTADAAVVLSNIADRMDDVAFENNGVSVILSTPYYPGTLREQALAVVQHAGIEWNGIENGVLAIWPRGGSRGGLVPRIAKDTGMVGYPTYTSTGLIVTTTFNPVVRHGGQIDVESSLTPACGRWVVAMLTHDIEAEVPSGKWLTLMQVAKPGYAPVV
ncbi:MAG TPA: hypothetical protein VF453_06540 [Burkholderiaceae bacterium]